jgi:diguanylate cyclase (GGDEF)-like protein/PAS domain S-box-containing protein
MNKKIIYLATFLLACGLLLAAFIGERINNQRYAVAVRAEVQNRVAETRARLEGNLNSNISLVKSLVSVIHLKPNLTQAQFEQAARPLFQGQTSLRNIGAAPDMVIRLMYPLKGNEAAIGLDYRNTPSQTQAAQRARDELQIVLAGPVKLVQGGFGLIARLPVFLQADDGTERFWGLVSAVINIEDLYRKSGLLDEHLPMQLSIRGKDGKGAEGEVFFGNPGLFSANPVLADISLPYGAWQIAAVPIGGWPTQADNAWLLRGGFLMLMALFLGAFLVLIRALREASLAQSRAESARVQLSATLENTPNVAIQWYDEAGKVLYWNLASEKLYGWKSIEALGKTRGELICTPEAAAGFLKTLSAISATSQAIAPYESRFNHKQNGAGWVLSTTFAIPMTDGRFCFVCMDVDITDRKAAEESMRQSEARFRQMLETSPIAVRIASDSGRRVLFANQRYIELIGSRTDAVIGVDPQRYYAHPEDYADILEQLSRGESITDKLVELTLPGGERKWVLASYLRLEYTNESGVLGWFYDITERMQMEAALQRSEATSRALINASMESMILLDENANVVIINEVGARRLNLKPHELIGRNIYQHLPPELAKSRESVFRQVFESGKAAHFQDVRDGMHFDISHFPVYDERGKVVNIAIYAADITEQFQLQGIDRLLHRINQDVLRGRPLEEIFDFICAEVTRIFAYPFAWIGRKDEGGAVSIRAHAGAAMRYCAELERIGIRWDETPQSKGPTGTAIKTGQAQLAHTADAGFQPWREAALQHQFNSILGLPLIIRGEIYGAFTVYALQEHSFDDPVVLQRLTGIAGRICVALEAAMDQQQVMLLSTALSATANGVFITDNSGRIQWLNKAFTALTGFGERETLGLTPNILNSKKQGLSFFQKMWQDILRGEVWRSEMVNRRRDGSEFFVRQTITPIRDAQGQLSHFIAIMEDISAEKEAEARIEHMAHYDSLTNLPNRALFIDRLRQTLASTRRNNHPGALMFLDLDRFKSVNDTLGHHAGDLLLQLVAARLKASVRESDTVARLGGDEFTVILPEISDEHAAAKVAEKIIEDFSTPFDLEGLPVSMSTSIGIAMFSRMISDDDEILKRADTAMYVAKDQGRNTFSFFTQARIE